MAVTFVWRGTIFVVNLRQDGTVVYRDYAHLGGPWSDAKRATDNKSLDLGFRRSLRDAVARVLEDTEHA